MKLTLTALIFLFIMVLLLNMVYIRKCCAVLLYWRLNERWCASFFFNAQTEVSHFYLGNWGCSHSLETIHCIVYSAYNQSAVNVQSMHKEHYSVCTLVQQCTQCSGLPTLIETGKLSLAPPKRPNTKHHGLHLHRHQHRNSRQLKQPKWFNCILLKKIEL